MKTALILPAYNEEATIEDVIREFHKQKKDMYIYVIDNNSKDKTNEIARKTLKKLKCKGGVIFEGRQGKAFAVRRAFQTIDADIYVMADADLTYPAEELNKLLQPVIDDEADMVVGDRLTKGDYFEENKRPFHNFGNKLVIKIINMLFKSDIKDAMTGYRVFSKKFVKNLPVLSKGFEIETEITLHTLDKRFRLLEIPVDYKDRIEGSVSKLKTYSDGFRVIKIIFKIFKDYKPLTFFGIISIIFFLLSLAAGIPVILEFIETRYITKVPSAILATGLMIVSILSLSIGMILSTIVKHFKADYEIKINNFKG